jgi:hypothetical protein
MWPYKIISSTVFLTRRKTQLVAKVAPGPSIDYSLKEGQSITISIAGISERKNIVETNEEAVDFSKFAIAPPPSFNLTPKIEKKEIKKKPVQWDDFGDFNDAVADTPFSDSKSNDWTKFD